MGPADPATVEIEARDGYRLEATRFDAPTAPGQVTIVAPAMGVPRRFYDAFARGLADQGHRVVSFDYRGIGGSAPEHLPGCDARLLDWGRVDLASVIDHVLDAHAPDRLGLVGHSVSGQILGLADNADAIDRTLMVASVKGHWRLWSGRQAAILWVYSHLAVPVLARVLGYLPARWIGLGGEDLPRDVALDWARWIRHPDYVVDETGQHPSEAYARYTGEIRALSFEDDWYAPPDGVEALLAMYPNAVTEHEHLVPRQHGLDGIGHFGYFRKPCRPLWVEAAAWLAGSKTAPDQPRREKKGGREQRAREDGV